MAKITIITIKNKGAKNMPNERVILIKGDAGKWYDQAIFIVKQNTPAEKIPKDFVLEAENIIRSYLIKKKKNAGNNKAGLPQISKPALTARPVRNKKFDKILNIIMLLGCVVIAAALMYGFFG